MATLQGSTDAPDTPDLNDLFSKPSNSTVTESKLPSMFESMTLNNDFTKNLPSDLKQLEEMGMFYLLETHPPELREKLNAYKNNPKLPANIASIVLPTNINDLVDDQGQVDKRLFWTKYLDEANQHDHYHNRPSRIRPRGGTIFSGNATSRKVKDFRAARKTMDKPRRSSPISSRKVEEEGYSLRNPPKKPGLDSMKGIKICQTTEEFDAKFNFKHYNHQYARELDEKKRAQHLEFEQALNKYYEKLFKETGSYTRPREKMFPGGRFSVTKEWIFIDADLDEKDRHFEI